MDNKTKILIISPFVLAVILAVTADYMDIPFKTGIPQYAYNIAPFTPTGLTIKNKERVYSSPDIKGPLDFDLSAAVETSLPENNPLPQVNKNDRSLSLIIISGTDKTAIINGVPVKEGDRIADMRIVKIETDRVLLKGKTLKWMYLD